MCSFCEAIVPDEIDRVELRSPLVQIAADAMGLECRQAGVTPLASKLQVMATFTLRRGSTGRSGV
jgi:hypothetical protein